MTRAELEAKYPRGCRVRATDDLRAQFRLAPGTDAGVVVGYGRRGGDLIRIRRDGLKAVRRYHVDFWEPVAAAGVA